MALLRRELRRRLNAFIGPLIGLSLICYFVYHAIQGDRGFLSWARLTQKVEAAEAELSSIQQKRASLEDRVSRLNTAHLDLDLLEQQVRTILGMHHNDELIILDTKED